MHDRLTATRRAQQRFRIADVRSERLDTLRIFARITIRTAREQPNFVTCLEQSRNCAGADDTCSSGNKDLHAGIYHNVIVLERAPRTQKRVGRTGFEKSGRTLRCGGSGRRAERADRGYCPGARRIVGPGPRSKREDWWRLQNCGADAARLSA